MSSDKITIGWQEIISLPQLNIPAIKVKIDTGAKTSSLHAENIKHFQKEGKEYISFEVHPIQKNKKIIIQCEAPLVEKRHVKSSSGCKEHRPVIRTKLRIGKYDFMIDLNLTKRDYMGFRMLLGRNAMQGAMLIDPQHKYLHGQLLNKEIKSKYKS